MDQDYVEAINGLKMHFRVRGASPKNPYLLILHGGPGFSAPMFYPWGKSLEDKINVIYLDQRGCGESERLTTQTMKTFTVKNLVFDIESVRKFLKIDRWFVLGHSWGGMLGLEYVFAFPKNISGYIHMDGLLSQPETQNFIFERAALWTKRDLESKIAERIERGKRLEPYLSLGPKLPAGPQRMMSAMQFALSLPELYYADLNSRSAYQAKINAELKRYNIPVSSLYASEPGLALLQNDGYATRDASPLLPKITAPTLVIHGRQDGIVPLKHAERVAKIIPKAKLLALDSCGHFPFIEKPEKTTQSILDFVK